LLRSSSISKRFSPLGLSAIGQSNLVGANPATPSTQPKFHRNIRWWRGQDHLLHKKLITVTGSRHYEETLANIGFDKLFSEEEANELIPRLEILMRQLQMQATSLRARIDELSVTDPSILHCAMSEIVGRYPELRSFATNMADAAAQIESFGCILKDIDLGLIDFPYDADDEVVFLCWQFGEPRVVAWHSVNGGFSERQPLAGAPNRWLN